VLAQARAIGQAQLMRILNAYVADSDISFGGGAVVRAGRFMDPLVGTAPDTPPLGLMYRVLFRAGVEAPVVGGPPVAACDFAKFEQTISLYANVLAPQYPSQYAVMRPTPAQVREIVERARMLDVVYGIHQHHPSALWPLLSHAYGPEVSATKIDAAKQVTDDLLARARAGDWDVDIPLHDRALSPDQRRVFSQIVEQSRSWTTEEKAQFPAVLVDGQSATLPTPPLLTGTLFSAVVQNFAPHAASDSRLGERLQDFVLEVLQDTGARTIAGPWHTRNDSGDIDAGFETEDSVVIFECKKSCQGFWGRVEGGGQALDHFIRTIARGVAQGLRLQNALESSDAVFLRTRDGERRLALGDREFFHFVLTGADDGAFQAKLFLHSILIGLYGTSVTFSAPATSSPSVQRDWQKRETRANQILRDLTNQVGRALPAVGNKIDILFRNLNAMPLPQLTFAATTLKSISALETCLRVTAAVQNSQAGPHEDFYFGYRYARGELSHNEKSLLTATSTHRKLWVR
jgi:hypothetical protein